MSEGKGKKVLKELGKRPVDVEKYRSKAERAIEVVKLAIKDGLLDVIRV